MKNKINIEIDVKNTEPFKNFLDLISLYIDELPKELQISLKELADDGICDFTAESVHSMGVKEIETSEGGTLILSANKILKRIKYLNDDKIQLEKHLDHFWVKDKKTNEIIYEW